MNSNLLKNTVAVIGLLVVMATSAAAQLISTQVNSRVVKPGKELLGKSYNELAGKWTNWLIAEPIATNPAFDPDGRFCDLNQEGHVWFLPSTFEGVVTGPAKCLPARRSSCSLGGVFLSFSPEFPAAGDPCLQMATDAEKVRCDVNNDVPVAPGISFKASLDGAPVRDLFAYRAQSKPGGFTLRVPNPSFLTDLGFAPGDRSPRWPMNTSCT